MVVLQKRGALVNSALFQEHQRSSLWIKEKFFRSVWRQQFDDGFVQLVIEGA
jgi:hypothetical protein